MADQEFHVDAKDFTKLWKALGDIDVDIRKQLRKRMMDSAKPVVQAVKDAVLEKPSKTGSAQYTRKKRGEALGLRQSIANAVKSDFNGSRHGAIVHIRVSRTKFVAASGDRYKSLPYHYEGRYKKKWRHPVFADAGASFGTWEGAWVEQKPQPFLGPTVVKYKEKYQKEVDAAVLDALDQAKRRQNV